jgi:fructokinase
MIVVAGEALVDLVPAGELLRPLPGGSPFNVAVGLGRLGVRTAYLGRLSRDGFGRRLRARLEEERVELDLAAPTDAPTTLAVVHLDEQARASYAFYLEGTSAADLRADGLPLLPEGAALHVSLGAVTLDTEPAGGALLRLLEREHERRLVCLDPNVRPGVIEDLPGYRRRLETALERCDLVKASEEDLALLDPDRDPLDTAARWLTLGPRLVVVTRGPEGAVALRDDDRVEVPGRDVEVVDTVGAGDAFTSALLAHLEGRALLTRAGLDRLAEDEVQALLTVAARHAARTCEREGADPPRGTPA